MDPLSTLTSLQPHNGNVFHSPTWNKGYFFWNLDFPHGRPGLNSFPGNSGAYTKGWLRPHLHTCLHRQSIQEWHPSRRGGNLTHFSVPSLWLNAAAYPSELERYVVSYVGPKPPSLPLFLLARGMSWRWLPTFPVQSKVVSSSFVLWNIRFSYCSPPHQIGTVGENGILYRVFRALSFKSLGESTFVWKIASYHSIKYVSWRTCIQNQSWGHQHRKRGQISLGIPDPELTKCSVSFWSGTLNIHREI